LTVNASVHPPPPHPKELFAKFLMALKLMGGVRCKFLMANDLIPKFFITNRLQIRFCTVRGAISRKMSRSPTASPRVGEIASRQTVD